MLRKADNKSRTVLVAAAQDSRTFSGFLPFTQALWNGLKKPGRGPMCWAPGHAPASPRKKRNPSQGPWQGIFEVPGTTQEAKSHICCPGCWGNRGLLWPQRRRWLPSTARKFPSPQPLQASHNPALCSPAEQGHQSSSRCQAHCLSSYPFCEYLLLVCGKGRYSGAGCCEKSLTLQHLTNKSHYSSSLASAPSSLCSPNPFREQLNQCLTCTNSCLTAIWKGFRWGLRQGSG